MLSVAILCEFPTLNGGEHSLLAAIPFLRNQCRLQFIVPGTGPLVDQLRLLEQEVIPWPTVSGSSLTPAEVARAIRSLPVDLVHANSLTMSRHLGAVAGELHVPCTGHVRDIMRLSESAIRQLNQLAGLACVSEAVRAELLGQGITPEKCSVIYNGVDFERFRPRPRTGLLKQELGLPPEAPLVMNLGQICLRKGQDVFVQVALQLLAQRDDIHFLQVGLRHSRKLESIEFDQQLDAAFAAVGRSTHWHRLGERADIPYLLNEVDILLHTARQEPLGRVLLEAAASGTPIVATEVGGTAEILHNGLEAWLCPADAVECLTKRVVRLLDDPVHAASMAARARERCQRQFSLSEHAAQLLRFWQLAQQSGRA